MPPRKPKLRMMVKQFSAARTIGIVAIIMLGCAVHVIADNLPLPTALAERGKLILDDDGSTSPPTMTQRLSMNFQSSNRPVRN